MKGRTKALIYNACRVIKKHTRAKYLVAPLSYSQPLLKDTSLLLWTLDPTSQHYSPPEMRTPP